MNTRLIASVTLGAFLNLGLPALADIGGTTAGPTVSAQSGRVLQSSAGGWAELGHAPLKAGDKLRTPVGSQATFRFPDGTRVRMGPSTDLRIVSADSQGTRLALHRGKILGATGSRLQVATERSLTSATQGDFVVKTTAAGADLAVVSGDASLEASPTPVQLAEFQNLAMSDQKGKKGQGVRQDSTREAVGGQETRPSRQVQSPPPPPVQTPQAQPAPQQNTTQQPPQEQQQVAQDGEDGEGTNWLVPSLLGLLGVTGIVLALNGDDDTEPFNVQVPSPSLP